jgi:pheromone shutdown protein TraB
MEDTATAPPAPPRGIVQNLRERALAAGSAAVGNAVKSMYSKLNSSGFNAGEEFVVAVREGQKIGAAIVLGDRDVELTLRRLTEALAQTDLTELMSPDSELEKSMSELMPGPPPSQDMSDADFRQEMSIYVETMKAKENVRKIMGQLKKAAPLIYRALVEERDIYMANGLNSLDQFSNIVAVMGIAHMEGVENTLQSLGWEQVPLKCPKK